jgi:hypothetical protein
LRNAKAFSLNFFFSVLKKTKKTGVKGLLEGWSPFTLKKRQKFQKLGL